MKNNFAWKTNSISDILHHNTTTSQSSFSSGETFARLLFASPILSSWSALRLMPMVGNSNGSSTTIRSSSSVKRKIQHIIFKSIFTLYNTSSKGAKRTIFNHITVILQYCWYKTISRSGDMYRDDSGILSLVIKCFGITTLRYKISLLEFPLLKLHQRVCGNYNFFNKFKIDVSSLFFFSSLLMSSLCAIVICQKYFGNHKTSSQIHLFAPLLDMRCCTLQYYINTNC